MSLLTRLLDVSKAAIHEALDKLEQPEMMMNQYVRSTEEDIHRLEQAVLKEEALHQKLEREKAYYERLADEEEQKAKGYIAAGKTEEARRALETRLVYVERASEREQAGEASQSRLAEHKRFLDTAVEEYARMKARRDELALRAQKVHTETSVPQYGDVDGLLHSHSAKRGFERMEEVIQQREQQLELANEARSKATSEREALVEVQLARLRSDMQQP